MRAILNYGHTFAHALENLSGYGTLLHGEAVAIGMVQAADFATRLGVLAATDAQRIKALIKRADLPVEPPKDIEPNSMVAAMALDKKTLDGTLRFVLPNVIGRVHLCEVRDTTELVATLNAGSELCLEDGL